MEAEECQRRALGIDTKLAADYPAEESYREGQAEATWRLGDLLDSADHPAEAELAFRQVVALYEKLTADYPRKPWFRHELACAYWRLGGALRSTGRAQEGETPCRHAVAIQENLVADFPDVNDYRSRLFAILGELAENLLQQAKHAEAAKVAEKMVDALRKDPNASQTAAAVLARCVPLAEKDVQLSEIDRKAAAKRYADRAKELTREATQKK